jgi:hypothetical protein
MEENSTEKYGGGYFRESFVGVKFIVILLSAW